MVSDGKAKSSLSIKWACMPLKLLDHLMKKTCNQKNAYYPNFML